MESGNGNGSVVCLDTLILDLIVAKQRSIPCLLVLKLVNSELASIVQTVSRTNVATLVTLYWNHYKTIDCKQNPVWELQLMGRRPCVPGENMPLLKLLANNGDLRCNLEKIFALFPTIRFFEVSSGLSRRNLMHSGSVVDYSHEYLEQSIIAAFTAQPVAVRRLRVHWNRRHHSSIVTIPGECLLNYCSQTLRKVEYVGDTTVYDDIDGRPPPAYLGTAEIFHQVINSLKFFTAICINLNFSRPRHAFI